MDIPRISNEKSQFEHNFKLALVQYRGFSEEKSYIFFGNSAKVSCPKEFLDKTVYLVIVKE